MIYPRNYVRVRTLDDRMLVESLPHYVRDYERRISESTKLIECYRRCIDSNTWSEECVKGFRRDIRDEKRTRTRLVKCVEEMRNLMVSR